MRKKLTTYLTVFLMFFYQVGPVYAALLPSLMIQDELDANPQFERSTSYDYQYQAAPYIESSAPMATTLESFYKRLESSLPSALGDVTYVPISVGDINIIIPTYKRYKYVGTPLVQSRYVRTQVNRLLGRNLINAEHHATESAQLDYLYNNAFEFASLLSDLFYGRNIGTLQSVPNDMIWPEERTINGEQVVVPILYLSEETIKNRKVTNHTAEVYGDVSLNSLTIDGVTIKFGRDSFIELADSLLNNQGTILGEGDLEIVAGGSVTNLSGIIQSENNLSILAANITNQTVVHRYDLNQEQGTRYGEISTFDAVKGELIIRSYGDIIFKGGQAYAGANLTLAADGNISLVNVELHNGSQTRFGSGTQDQSTISFLQSGLTASETIQLIANGQIVIKSAQIVSDNGHIELLAGMGITIEDELQIYQSKAKGKFGKRKVTESVYQTVAIRALLDAGKGIKLHSEFGDITLKATDITSVEGTQITASNGGVNLLMTTETDHYSYSSVKKGLFTTTTKSEGHNKENGVPNTIVGGFSVEALSGVRIEYEGDADLSLEEQIGVISQFEGMEWMAIALADAQANPELYEWDEILLQHETWKESNTSLSPAFMAVVTIAVAIAAGPAGAQFAAYVGSQGVVAAAIAAGTTALISQASVALANGAVNGDVAGAMEDFASDDTLKSLAVSMVTAGAIKALDTAVFGLDSAGIQEVVDNVAAGASPEQIQAAVQSAQDLAVQSALGQSLASQAGQAVLHSAVNSGVSTIINGGSLEDFGEGFGNNLANSLVSQLGEELAGDIGDAYSSTDINKLSQYLAHAALGCGLGVAKGAISGSDSDEFEGNCSSGAGGAVVGELTGEIFLSLSEVDIYSPEFEDIADTGANYAEVLAALAVAIAGGDPNIAAFTGRNSAENNALSMIEKIRAAIGAVGCLSDENTASCLSDVGLGALADSVENDKNLVLGLKNGLEKQATDLLNLPSDIKKLAIMLVSGDIVGLLGVLKDGLVSIPVEVIEVVEAAIALKLTADTPEDYLKVGDKMSIVLTTIMSAGAGKVAYNVIKKSKLDTTQNSKSDTNDADTNDADTNDADLESEFDEIFDENNAAPTLTGPGSAAHKTQRWQDYQDRNGQWSYDRWSKTYDGNMVRAKKAHAIADEYHQKLGWGEREKTVKNVGGTGQSRRLDIVDIPNRKGVEVKSGYTSRSEAVRSELERDKMLVESKWKIEWYFDGTASKPLLDALDDANIPWTFKDPSLIPNRG